MHAVEYPHISIRGDGQVYIAGTRLKVLHIIGDHLRWHWDAEALRRQYPQLTLGQIYGALSYYYDHEEEMNRTLADRQQLEERLLSELGQKPLQQRLSVLQQSREQAL